jgi:hypothetical protein
MDVGSDTQLTFTNIIVQSVDMWVISGDTEGRLDMSLFGSGQGYYMTKGQSVPITWERADRNSPTYYYYEDGTSVLMNTGKTYVSIFPSSNFNTIIIE